MKYEEIVLHKKYESFQDFYSEIIDYRGELHYLVKYVFRGHSSCEYELIPSALRPGALDKYREKYKHLLPNGTKQIEQCFFQQFLLSEFAVKANYNNLKTPVCNVDDLQYWHNPDNMKLAAIAQHHGIPTILLDWSFELNTALYFAVVGNMDKETYEKGEYITIWGLDYNKYLKYKQVWQGYPIINAFHFLIFDYYQNKNLGAQKGLFTYYEYTHQLPGQKPLDKLLLDRFNTCIKYDNILNQFNLNHFIVRMDIKKSQVKEIYKYLSELNSTASKLFPDYSGVKREIDEDAYFMSL